jgi:hypothetical protein
MLATTHPSTPDSPERDACPAVLARVDPARADRLHTHDVLRIVRRAVGDGVAFHPATPLPASPTPAAPTVTRPDSGPAVGSAALVPTLTLRHATHHGPLGSTTTARVFERFLDRLDDRLADLADAIDRADLAAADALLQAVARVSRQHGCRAVCHAAEDALATAQGDAASGLEPLRESIDELNALAREVASSTRRWSQQADPPPRA